MEIETDKVVLEVPAPAAGVLVELTAPDGATVVAEQPSRLYYLSTAAFRRIEIERPQLASAFNRAVINLVAQRLRHSEDEVRTLLQ